MMPKKLESLRKLDLDDMYVMLRWSEGCPNVRIAKDLLISMGAISQRLAKMEKVFEGISFRTSTRRVPTDEGRRIGILCGKVLAAMMDDG